MDYDSLRQSLISAYPHEDIQVFDDQWNQAKSKNLIELVCAIQPFVSKGLDNLEWTESVLLGLIGPILST